MFQQFFHYLIVRRRKDVPFLIFLAFLITFGISRMNVYLVLEGVLPEWLFLTVGQTRVHHFLYGIFGLSIVGFVTLVYPALTQKFSSWFAILYGIFLGLTFDEFGMWLRLEDDYWIRHSYDAVLIIGSVLLTLVYFRDFWHAGTRLVKWLHLKIRRLK